MAAIAVGATTAATVAVQVVHESQAIVNDWNTNYRGHAFGSATSISPDGNVLVVGDPVALGWGAAYVYERGDDGWVFRQRLTLDDGDLWAIHGFAVAASNDTIVVGAPGENDDAGNTGYAHVYTRTAGTWVRQQRLQPSYANPAQLDRFGYSVAIEGDRILVGALSGPADGGAVSAFERSGGVWNEVPFPGGTDALYASQFGFTVEMDGDRAAVSEIATGTVYMYVHGEGGWSLEQQLIPEGPERWAGFGWALSLHGDRLLASAPLDGVGDVLVYERREGTWVYTQSLPGPGTYGMFGSALAQTDDHIVVGNAEANVIAGSAHVFAATAEGGWTLVTTIEPIDRAEGDYFGWSLAVAGEHLAITAWSDDVDGWFSVGSVRTYEGLDAPAVKQFLSVNDGPSGALGSGAAIEGDVMVAGAPHLDHNGLAGAGALYIYMRGPDGWALHQEIFGECDGGSFGQNVVMDVGRIVTVGRCGTVARVHTFEREGDTWVERAVLEPGARFTDIYESIVLQGDTLLLGQPSERINGVATGGAVHVFMRSDGQWQYAESLHASDAYDSDRFGSSIAISGNRMLVGAPGNTIGYTTYQGAAYFFLNDGAGWVEQQRILASDGTEHDGFGGSVAFAGEQLVVGAVGDLDLAGAVYVFDVVDGDVVEAQRLTAVDRKTNEAFGHRIVVDGDVMVVGTPLKNVFRGCGDLFVKGPQGWVFRARLVASDGDFDDQLTTAMAIDGERIVLAAPRADGTNGAGGGKVYVFEGIPAAVEVPDPDPPPPPTPTPTSSPGGGGSMSPLLLALLLIGKSRRRASRRGHA